MKKSFGKFWVAAVVATGLMVGAVVQEAAGAAVSGWRSGSLFSNSVTAGTDSALTSTNVFWLLAGAAGAGGSTNVGVTNRIPVILDGITSPLLIQVDMTGAAAYAAANSNIIRIAVQLSSDGVTYTTHSNGIVLDVVPAGNVKTVFQTNIAQSVLGGAYSMRLGSIASTNSGGGVWFSNITYRFQATR